MEEYILFLDETNKTTSNPNFCLAGMIIKRSVYEDVLIPKINQMKIDYFNNAGVIFHYTDMKSNKGVFNIFSDNSTRNKFWNELYNVLDKIDFTVIGVYHNAKLMKGAFSKGSTTNYDIAFRHILDLYMHFLKNNNAYGYICIESRTFKENAFLQKIL